jgi:hypothetical protein
MEGYDESQSDIIYERIAAMKETMDGHQLFAGFPAEFAEMFQYVRHLRFDETPDYEFLELLCMVVSRRPSYRNKE